MPDGEYQAALTVLGGIRGRWGCFGPPPAASAVGGRLLGALKLQARQRAIGITG